LPEVAGAKERLEQATLNIQIGSPAFLTAIVFWSARLTISVMVVGDASVATSTSDV
jgi:hypothetical protein